VAVQLAIIEPGIAAVILQGPVDGTFRDIFAHQNQDLAVEYLRTVADTDQDCLVSAEDVFAGNGRQPGTVGSFAILITLDLASLGGQPGSNPMVDQNGDGLIDIEAELVPNLEAFFANFDERSAVGQSPYGPQYATDQQLPTILESVGELQQPVLILQGENDANVRPAAAERIDAALAEAGHADHTLIIYPGLGHSLGPAATVYADNFAPIATEPLADLVAWLDSRLGR
jgi:pimeloyl-ACP methyl ester carboxylesterase